MTTKNELLIRQATDADLPSIIELFTICLRQEGTLLTEQFWHWKHHQNPFGASPVLLAFSKDQLVGLRAFLRWQWKTDDQELQAFRAVDTATHPDFQGKGIFKLLTTQLWQQIQQDFPGSFVFNTPNDQSRPGYLKMGWQVLGKPGASFRYFRVGAMYRNKHWERAVVALDDLQLNSLPTSLLEHDGFHIHTPMSAEYIHWRYRQIPDRKYGYSQFETSKGTIGFIFYLRNRRGFTELRICNEIVLHKKESGEQLIEKGWQLLAKQFAGCAVTRLCSPHEKGSRLLKNFIPNVTIRISEEDTNFSGKLTNICNWHFDMGTLELF